MQIFNCNQEPIIASRLIMPWVDEKTKNQAIDLELRPLHVGDASAVLEALEISSKELHQFMPFIYYPQTLESQYRRIATNLSKYWLGEDFGFGIFKQQTGDFLGGTGLHSRSLNPKCLEIGFWISTPYTGRGLASLVVKILSVYGFSYLGLERIQCGHDENNLASARVNDKCGFEIEARMPHFLPPGTAEMKERGWLGNGTMIMRRILKENIENLDWYQAIHQRLQIFNYAGNLVNSDA